MNAYVYCAALFCESCIAPTLVDLEPSEDSGEYPQGPYSNGAGEADTPQHCDACKVFLENPLTPDGEEYVREALTEATGDAEVLRTWAEFYDYIDVESEA